MIGQIASCRINSTVCSPPVCICNSNINSARIKICQCFICEDILRFPRESHSSPLPLLCYESRVGVQGVKRWGPEALISPLQAWSSRPWCSSCAFWSPSSSLSCPCCTDRIWSSSRSCGACGERRHISESSNFSVLSKLKKCVSAL